MNKKITSVFAVALMLASCLCMTAYVPGDSATESDDMFFGPGYQQPALSQGMLDVGETLAMKYKTDSDMAFETISQIAREALPGLLNEAYEMYCEYSGEMITYEEFKEMILNLIEFAGNFVSADTVKLLRTMIEDPENVVITVKDFETAVEDLVGLLNIILPLLLTDEDGEIMDIPEIKLENFEFGFDTYSVGYANRTSTYTDRFGGYSYGEIAIGFDLTIGDKTFSLKDGSIVTKSYVYVDTTFAPMEVSVSDDVYTSVSFTGTSNFLNDKAVTSEDLFLDEPSEMLAFEIGITGTGYCIAYVEPAADPAFTAYGTDMPAKINVGLFCSAEFTSNVPFIQDYFDDMDFRIAESSKADVLVDRTGDYTIITFLDIPMNIEIVGSEKFVLSVDTDDLSISFEKNKTGFCIDIGYISEYGEEMYASMSVYENTLTIIINDEVYTFDIDEIISGLGAEEYYYGEDLILTEEEVARLNSEFSAYTQELGILWIDIKGTDTATVEFWFPGVNGAIQTEVVSIGCYATEPGNYVTPDGRCAIEWKADDGSVFDSGIPVTKSVKYTADDGILLLEAPAKGDLRAGMTYVWFQSEEDSTVIDSEALVPGALLYVCAPDEYYTWTFMASPEDDLSGTVIDTMITEKDMPNSAYIKNVIGDRGALYLDFSASGVMPDTCCVEYFVAGYIYGDLADVYFDDGRSLTFVETVPVSENGLTEFDVDHCSGYVVAEHADAPAPGMDMTMIIVIIIVILVIIVAAVLVIRKKNH